MSPMLAHVLLRKLATLPCLLLFTLATVSPGLASEKHKMLSLREAEKQVQEAEAACQANQADKCEEMVAKLQPLLVQLTEMHSQLFQVLDGTDLAQASRTAEVEKEQTVAFAKLRDRMNYQAGILSMRNGYELEAAKHFVEVVRSQVHTVLAEKAFNRLRELGFSPNLSISNL